MVPGLIRRVADRASERNSIMQYWMSGYGTGRGATGSPENWVPAVDVLMQEGGDLMIVMELPGVRREEIDVSLAGRDLTVYGHKDGHEESAAEYYTRERYCGPFQRTVSLPNGLEKERVSCHYERGKLEITIRDYAETLRSETRKVEIQGADG